MDERQENGNVLVLWESKHGSTADISYAIGAVLRAQGLHVSLVEAGRPLPDQGIDAYVIGSAIYAGHWMKHVKRFVHDNAAMLRDHPVWLFSSGPIGNPPFPVEPPSDIAELTMLTGARGHEIFSGNLDRTKLSFAERAITGALHAPEGDFRDWAAIKSWASDIAQRLSRNEVRA